MNKPVPLHERWINVRCIACDRSISGSVCDSTCTAAGQACGLRPLLELQAVAKKAHRAKPVRSPADDEKQYDPHPVTKDSEKFVQQPSSASVEPHNEDRQPGTAHHACYTD